MLKKLYMIIIQLFHLESFEINEIEKYNMQSNLIGQVLMLNPKI